MSLVIVESNGRVAGVELEEVQERMPPWVEWALQQCGCKIPLMLMCCGTELLSRSSSETPLIVYSAMADSPLLTAVTRDGEKGVMYLLMAVDGVSLKGGKAQELVDHLEIIRKNNGGLY